EAVTDRSDLPGASRQLAEMAKRRLEVVDTLRLVEALVEGERLLPFGVRLIGDLDARLLAPEQIRAERDVTLPREAVGEIAHDLVDAENLLDHEHARAAAGRWCREISAEAAAIGGADGDLGHGHAPVCGLRESLAPPRRACHPARLDQEPALMDEQLGLGLEPPLPAVSAELAAAGEHAVAGDDDRQRIAPAGAADILRHAAGLARDLAIAPRLAVGDALHRGPHLQLEGGAFGPHRQIEIAALAREVGAELA